MVAAPDPGPCEQDDPYVAPLAERDLSLPGDQHEVPPNGALLEAGGPGCGAALWDEVLADREVLLGDEALLDIDGPRAEALQVPLEPIDPLVEEALLVGLEYPQGLLVWLGYPISSLLHPSAA